MKSRPVYWIALPASGLCLAQEDREKDVYAIYSLLMMNPETSHGADDNPRYLILDTTVAGVPTEPCVNASGESRERTAEILKDFLGAQESTTKVEAGIQDREALRTTDRVRGEAARTHCPCHGCVQKSTSTSPPAMWGGESSPQPPLRRPAAKMVAPHYCL